MLPNIRSTKSQLEPIRFPSPTSPQLRAPIITSTQATVAGPQLVPHFFCILYESVMYNSKPFIYIVRYKDALSIPL